MGTNGHTSLCEDYISFETAKLLKEKGFDGVVSAHYNNLGGVIMGANPISKNTVKCPTLQMAMKWLRENYNIYCDIGYDDCDWFWNIISVDKNVPVEDRPLFIKNGLAGYKSYEDACETAIKYCLENLI